MESVLEDPKKQSSPKTFKNIMSKGFPEKAGFIAGKIARGLIDKFFENQIKNFDVHVTGQENITSLNNESYIVAGNHQIPEIPDKPFSLEKSKIGIDAPVIQNVIKKITEGKKYLRLIGDYTFPKPSKSEKFLKGFNKGIDIIPVVKRQGELNRDMVLGIKDAFARNEPILMFPEGHWVEDFDPNRGLESGTANIAIRYNKKIVPFYIHGASRWQKGQRIDLAFGEPIDPAGKTKEQVTEELKTRINELQKKYYSQAAGPGFEPR